jgi:hypothetical protein
MTEADLAALQSAVRLLEHPGFAARLTNMLGKPIELIGYALPASASQLITTATAKALDLALNVALRTMRGAPRNGIAAVPQGPGHRNRRGQRRLGLATLPIELPSRPSSC